MIITQRMKAAIKARPRLYRSMVRCVTAVEDAVAVVPKLENRRFRRLCAALPALVRTPTFVKVGANDGVTGDPCSDILLRSEWQGLLIEPVPYCFEALRKNYHDPRRFKLEQVAVGPRAGQTTFYFVDRAARERMPHLPPWFDQLGSFDRAHILKHMNGELEPFIVAHPVSVVPLSDLLARHGIETLHLLHIDAEGYDFEVLKTLDLQAVRPLMIYIEHRHLARADKLAMSALLQGAGYELRNCGGDYFALHSAGYAALRAN